MHLSCSRSVCCCLKEDRRSKWWWHAKHIGYHELLSTSVSVMWPKSIAFLQRTRFSSFHLPLRGAMWHNLNLVINIFSSLSMGQWKAVVSWVSQASRVTKVKLYQSPEYCRPIIWSSPWILSSVSFTTLMSPEAKGCALSCIYLGQVNWRASSCNGK